MVSPGRTMLQATVDRVAPDLVDVTSVYVITSERHAHTVREQLPGVPSGNVVGEPVARDSAPAVGVMAALVESQLGPDAIMIVLPADHEIVDTPGFRDALRAAIHAAEQGYLVTLGIPPTSPDTGFGYIQRGDPVHAGDLPVYHVLKFREKPNRETAEKYLATGEYFWNAGMFIARTATFRALYVEHLPEMETHLAELVAVAGTDRQDVTYARVYPMLTKISFDFAIAEKAEKVAVVPARIGWSDVGSWRRLGEVLSTTGDESENILFGARQHRLIDTQGCLIYAPHKLVAAIGLENMVVVDTPDALFIAPKERAEDVKRIVELLDQEGRQDLL